MKLAIDTELIGRDGSGNETYLSGILRGIQASLDSKDTLVLLGGDLEGEVCANRQTQCLSHPRGIIGDTTMGVRMRILGADIGIATYNAPLGFRKARVTIIHDAASRRVPSTFPRLLRQRIDLSIRRSIRVSDLVVTISEFSKSELVTLYPRLLETNVVVTPCAPHDVFYRGPTLATELSVRAKYLLPSVFLLAVGSLQPRKNLLRLAEASKVIDQPLVIVGRPIWGSDATLESLQRLGVQWLGHIPREDLAALYSSCAVFAYPSLYEGFGLPIIEAMAAGAPVVTSFSTACRETGGNAAILVNPECVDSIAAGLRSVVEDDRLRGTLVVAGREHAATFTWNNSGAILLRALRRLGAGGACADG